MDVLEKEKALQILIDLYKLEGIESKEERAKNKIAKRIGGSPSTFIKRFRELEKAGLVVIEQEKEFPFKEYIFLTPEGKEIARHLVEIERIMERIGKKKEG